MATGQIIGIVHSISQLATLFPRDNWRGKARWQPLAQRITAFVGGFRSAFAAPIATVGVKWTPLDLGAGLETWLKADGMLWQDFNRTTPVAARMGYK